MIELTEQQKIILISALADAIAFRDARICLAKAVKDKGITVELEYKTAYKEFLKALEDDIN